MARGRLPAKGNKLSMAPPDRQDTRRTDRDNGERRLQDSRREERRSTSQNYRRRERSSERQDSRREARYDHSQDWGPSPPPPPPGSERSGSRAGGSRALFISATGQSRVTYCTASIKSQHMMTIHRINRGGHVLNWKGRWARWLPRSAGKQCPPLQNECKKSP